MSTTALSRFWPDIAPRANEIYGHTSLRGLAALSVVGYHAAIAARGVDAAWTPALGFLLSSFLFVDLFFMLSGYIMAEAYGEGLKQSYRRSPPGARIPLRKRLGPVLRYWKRRLVKILPNYYVWLAISIALVTLRLTYFDQPIRYDSCYIESIWTHLALVQSFSATCIEFNIPLWSIVVELLAYLCFPVLILLLPVWPVFVALGAGLYAMLFIDTGTIDLLKGGPSVLRCLAGFMLGMAATRIVGLIPMGRVAWAQIPALLAVIVCVALDAQPGALAATFVLVVLTGANTGVLVAVLRQPVIYALGRASFSIYLAHVPILGVLILILSKIQSDTGIILSTDWRVFVPIAVVVCALIGLVAYQVIERRLERLL